MWANLSQQTSSKINGKPLYIDQEGLQSFTIAEEVTYPEQDDRGKHKKFNQEGDMYRMQPQEEGSYFYTLWTMRASLGTLLSMQE